MVFIIIISVLFFTPYIAEAIETDAEEALDLNNPIDIGFQINPPTPNKAKDLWSEDDAVVLYDDPRDELRGLEGVIKSNNDASYSRRNRLDRKLRNDINIRPKAVIENQRERDRVEHSRPIDNLRSSLNFQRPLDVLLNRRIKEEREEEIAREVKKALRNKENILEDITLQKRRIDREKHSRPDGRRLADRVFLDQNSNRLRDRNFANRRGDFGSSLERREMERRERLSPSENHLERNLKRNIDTNERMLRKRERNYHDEKLNWQKEEEQLKRIERRREAEILNEQRHGISHQEPFDKRHFNSQKPPILIYEKVPVPVHSNINGDYDRYVNDGYISKSYDERREIDNDSFLGRRPHHPDPPLDDEINIEEKILVDDVQSVLPLNVLTVDPRIDANFAFASNLAAASELEALNQAAVIVDLATLAQLQEVATLANIHQLNAINNQIALSQLQDAAVISTANAFEQAAAVATTAAVADQALLNQKLVGAAVVDDHIAKAQKVDFLNLVFKHGLRNALREQLKLHFRSKVEEDAFIHDLQVTKEDLITRLLLLRPYFKSPSQAGFIVPAFIPNIPVGYDAASHALLDLPQIPLLPTTLLAPDFRLPSEISHDLKDKIDIAFVEHILRLPEDIFYKVVHLDKKEFIITLFPILFRETVQHIKYDPVAHYHPNTPHKDIKEHHHHHLHIHKPPIDNGPDILYQAPPIKEYPESQGVNVDAHIFHSPGILHESPHAPHPHIGHHEPPHVPHPPFGPHEPPHVPHPPIGPHDLHHVPHAPIAHGETFIKGDSHHIHHKPLHPEHIHGKHHFIHSSVPNVIRHPILPVPNLDHPRLKIPQEGSVPFKHRPLQTFPRGSSLPLDGSSYIDYNSRERNDIFFLPNGNSRSSTLSPQPKIKPSEQVPLHPLISPHPVKGINIRHKGEEGHEGHEIISTTTPPPPISTTLFQDSFEERENAIRFQNSGEKFQFKQLISNDFRSVRLNSDIGSTITPLNSHEIGLSTLRPKKIDLSDFDDSSTSVPLQIETFSSNHNPFTTFRPLFPTVNSIDIPNDKNADDEDQAIELLASKETFTSTISPFTNELDSSLTPFGGFSGNIRQKPISERLNPDSQLENSLNWIPGTDINDDNHLASFFQKKTGNVTHGHRELNQAENFFQSSNDFPRANSAESVVDKVKRITNFFGSNLQENVPHIRIRQTNHKSLPPFFQHLNSLNDNIKSPDPISEAKKSFQDTEHIIPEFPEIQKIGVKNKENSVLRSEFSEILKDANNPENSILKSFGGEDIRNVPMPRRIDFARPSIHDIAHVKKPIGQSQGPLFGHAPTLHRHNGRDSKTFAGISVQGLETLPNFLREPPLCSNAEKTNRSFCLFPDGYDSEKASEIIRIYDSEIRELLKVIQDIPKIGPDLREAAKQIPSLNLNVSCETEERRVQLSWSRDILGSWLSILQTEPFQQLTTVITCSDSSRKKGCRPLLQPRPFVAFHPKDGKGKPYIMEFPLPVGCVYAES